MIGIFPTNDCLTQYTYSYLSIYIYMYIYVYVCIYIYVTDIATLNEDRERLVPYIRENYRIIMFTISILRLIVLKR
jgi:hypothetical protein